MEPQRNREAVRVDPAPATEPVYVVEQTAVPHNVAPTEPPIVEHTAAQPAVAPVVAPVAPEPHAVERVESIRSVAPHAVAAGILAVLMLVWGGVAMARAGFGDDLREPVVEVFGLSGNAVSGAIVAGLGVLLLIGAVSRDRGPVVFLTIVIGIAALVFAFEPDAGDEVLGVDSTLPVLLAIGCGVVLLVALALPTVTSRSQHIERI